MHIPYCAKCDRLFAVTVVAFYIYINSVPKPIAAISQVGPNIQHALLALQSRDKLGNLWRNYSICLQRIFTSVGHFSAPVAAATLEKRSGIGCVALVMEAFLS